MRSHETWYVHIDWQAYFSLAVLSAAVCVEDSLRLERMIPRVLLLIEKASYEIPQAY